MKSLYCEECGEYLMAGSGSLVDCSCGWKQPEDKGIDVAEYEALQAECEKLRKDAERYRWLRAHFGRFSERYDGGSDRVTKMVVNPDGWDVDPESLDAAIDAAIQATP